MGLFKPPLVLGPFKPLNRFRPHCGVLSDEEEMDLLRTEGPDLPPWSALAPRKSKAPSRNRARGKNNERGGAEGGFCAVLGLTHSEICRIFEKSRIFDLDLTPKRPHGWFGPLPGAFVC